MSDVECPYCGEDQDICTDDGYGLEEDIIFNQECAECEKVFAFTTSILVMHEAVKADCLNGAEHKFQLTNTIPKEYTRMYCPVCGTTRPCTDEEMTKFLGRLTVK